MAKQLRLSTKKVSMVSRAQFGESGAPGSEFVRNQVKAHPSSEYDIGRLALMGLVGAGTGLFAAHKMRKSKIAGGLLGGALGGGASLLLPQGDDDDIDVIAAGVDDKGRGSVLMVGSRRVVKEGLKRRTANLNGLNPILISSSNTKYPGWAGAILQHGCLVQRGMMHYVWDHAQYEEHTHVAPDYGFDTSEWGCAVGVDKYHKGEPTERFMTECHGRDVHIWSNCGPGVKSNYDPEWHNKTYWTNRFAEWPSPAWPRYGVGNHGRSDGAAGSIQCDLDPGHVQECLLKQILAIGFSKGKLNDKTLRAAGQGLSEWYLKNFALFPAYASMNAMPHIDSYWKDNSDRMRRFKSRYKIMIRRAQWFVWAAEMFRIHAGVPAEGISGWAKHCNEWGVGCASILRTGTKYTMVNYNSKSWTTGEDGKKITDKKGNSYNPILIEMKTPAVLEYMKLVMKETPPPFSTPPGKQLTINPPGMWRWMLDMPEIIGAMQPPVDAINCDYIKAIQYKRMSAATPAGLKAFTFIFDACVSIITAAGGPAMLIASSCMTFVMTVVRLATAEGRIDSSDLCRAVGSLLASVIEATGGTEVAGETFDDALKELEKLADDIGVSDLLDTALDMCDSLKNSNAWPYIDEWFGTIVDLEGLTGSDIDKQLDKIL